ncbi:MAG TPA: hypothetical protein VET87_16655 [Rubrivivax sp.]|nr:hypothetical protein [Rubrivivax sp.]
MQECYRSIHPVPRDRVCSREEALQWLRRFPVPVSEGPSAEIEVRLLYAWQDFTSGTSLERIREIGRPNQTV